MQVQVRHPEGEVPGCVPECGRRPKHFHDLRAARAGGGHILECACERRTPKHPTFEAARADWLRMTGQVIPAAAEHGAVPITRARERATTRR